MEIQERQKEHDDAAISPGWEIIKRFFKDKAAVMGLGFVIFLCALAIFAPLIVNDKPLLVYMNGRLFSPAFSALFAPDAQELFVEKIFNYLLLLLPLALILYLFLKRRRKIFGVTLIACAILLALPFFLSGGKMDKFSWREETKKLQNGEFIIFAPVPYSPFETGAAPYLKSTKEHIFGTDQIGRDVFARMVYGSRVSLAVGFLATTISMILGTLIGLFSGYKGGRIDLFVQRVVEIVICFPVFLLLLILMLIMLEHGSRQSILLVILILGFTGWPGLCRLVRGEVLKQRQMAYIQNCESLGVPLYRILLFHLLPNVSGPIFVSFAFSVAGAILTENSLSFLGFGVQDPTASWGEMLRQAFPDPLTYWHLMFWPGLAIFLTVSSFNFIAEGIRKSIDLKR